MREFTIQELDYVQNLIQESRFGEVMPDVQSMNPGNRMELCQRRMEGHYDGMSVLGFLIVHKQSELACDLINGLSNEQRVMLCGSNVGWDMINSCILSEAIRERDGLIIQALVADFDEDDMSAVRNLQDGRTSGRYLYDWAVSLGDNEATELLNAGPSQFVCR
jgi:hypothetical protein